MRGCKIGKVIPKDRKLAVLRTMERPYVHKSIENLSGAICEDSIMVGFFVIHRDRTTTTGWSHDRGATNADFLGACEVLRDHWIEREMR